MLTILPPRPLVQAALATELIPSECVARLLADRDAIEAELARALESELHDTERCAPPSEPGPTLLVDVVDGEPVSVRHSGFARLIALAHMRNPDLFDCAMAASHRTTIAGRQITLPPSDEVLERLVDYEPTVSSDIDVRDEEWEQEPTQPHATCCTEPPPDDPNDDDDPDDVLAEAAGRG